MINSRIINPQNTCADFVPNLNPKTVIKNNQLWLDFQENISEINIFVKIKKTIII